MSVGPDNPLRVELEHTAELVCRVDSKPPTESVRWEYSGRFIDTNFRHVIPQVSTSYTVPITFILVKRCACKYYLDRYRNCC